MGYYKLITMEVTDFFQLMSNSNAITLALTDFKQSIKHYKLWTYLSWLDIKLRYRGSALGPFWITLTMSIFIFAYGVVYSRLFHENLKDYFPFLTAGLLIWGYFSTILTESSEIYYAAKGFIYQIKLPYLIYNYRLISRNIIVFLHNFIVYVLVALYFKVPVTVDTLLFIPGFILLSINLFVASMLLSLLGTRYRDIPPVIASMVQVAFFVSPIMWAARLLSPNSKIIRYNPITYFLDITRSPLLGQAPELRSWLCCLIITGLMLLVAAPLFIKYRSRIAFWV